MHGSRNIFLTQLPNIKSAALIFCLLVVTSLAAQAPDQSTVIYDRAYFQQYSPVTLMDMIRNIPGGESILGRGGRSGGSNSRGFGSSDSQVLINGRRMSGKINSMSTTLARIQTAQVERIELIRGNAQGLDIRNQGIIYNVILQEGAGDSSSSFLDVGVTEIDGMSMEPEILASYNATSGPLEFGVSYQYQTGPRLNKVDEDILNPDRTPREFRSLFNATKRDNHRVTGTLAYEFLNGAILQLNGLFSDNERSEDREEDQFLIGTGGIRIPNAIEAGDISYSNEEFEIGGDLEFQVGNIGRLKTLFVVNRSDNTDEIIQDTIANSMTTRLFSSFADYDEDETIVRSAMTSIFGRHTLEYGAEAAFNTLNRTFAFNNDSLENAVVEEDRYEVFVTHSILLTEKINLQSALTEEYSTIFQDREGQTNKRNFRYLKPRVELRYDLTPTDQFRLLAERTVSQLNLNEFVASRNVDDDLINFGNPNLKPQKTWSYSIGYERRFANDGGSIELKALYEDISDHIDKILIGTDDSGVGNIGSAWRKNLELSLNTRFGFIGFPSAVLTFSYTYEDSETTDPFTGQKRRLRNSTPDYFRVNFRHDVEDTNFAYGLNAHRRSGRLRQDVSLFEVTDFEIHLGTAFVEYNVSPNVRFRFAAAHFLNEDGRIFDKTFYEGNIADGVIKRIDIQDWRIDPDYVLSLQATF
ncbi:MAG TPA: TonB-dependent receptor [Gammaproteobacteria bacterium]|jgi:outer membrane receptor protein involved in Fe transport|nr:TonB-dependent receptor [Gammaproteobacteria bacterium]|tara:strand:+ start:2663 stop:4753 length:2091 start_codon:yes stop_codon:yes gene_type:complete